MRAVLSALLTVLFLARGAAWAKCSEGSLDAQPPRESAIPLNAFIVLEGRSTYAEQDGTGAAGVVVGVRASGPTLVEVDGEVVPLHVETVRSSGVGVSQAILRPLRPLRPKALYELRLGGERIVSKRPGPLFAWPTTDADDRTAPRWRSAPSLRRVVSQRLGCGPARFAEIDVQVEDDSPTWIVATVRARGPSVQVRLGGQSARVRLGRKAEPRTFVVPIDDGQIWIGRSMCGGRFDLETGVRYAAELAAEDAAGNVASPPGAPIEFTIPPHT